MHKFMALLRINFRALLAAFSMGRKKKAAGGISALLLMAFLALYLSGVYSFAMASMLESVSLLHFLMPLMSIYAFLIALTFTAFGASGIIFGGKDNDLMLSLPVSAFSVMLCRVLALYLENLVFIGMWMLPAGVAYCVSVQRFSGWVLLCMLVIILLLPLLAALFALLIGFCLAFVSAKFTRKALLSNILYFVFFAGIMVAAMQFNRLPQFLLENEQGVTQVFHSYLLPFGLIQDMLAGSAAALLLFAGLCTIPFLAIVYAMSTRYKKILTGLSSHHTRNDYHLKTVETRGQFTSLFRKEAGRYFGTPIYLFNTGFGLIMIAGCCVYACFAKATILPFVTMLGGMDAVLPMLAAGVCFIISTVCTTCVSLSLEGKTLWILKEAPIAVKTLFAAKAGLNVAVVWPLTTLSLVLLTVRYGLPVAPVVALVATALALNVCIALGGLVINLLLPKMDCTNDTIVVKQSASSIFGIFSGFILVGLGVGLYFLLGAHLGLTGFLCLSTLLLAVIAGVLWRYLLVKGAVRFVSL